MRPYITTESERNKSSGTVKTLSDHSMTPLTGGQTQSGYEKGTNLPGTKKLFLWYLRFIRRIVCQYKNSTEKLHR